MAKRRSSQAGATASASLPPTFEITPADEIFCNHYAYYGNATLAYLKAYPEVKKTSCATLGCNLLKKVEIQEFIEVCKQEIRRKVNFTRERALAIFAEIAENPFHKQQREAANDLWEKLGLDKTVDSGPGATDVLRVSDRARLIAERRKSS